jgi:mono/diheme cytochrome c family protein
MVVAAALVALGGCRGGKSADPPFHLFGDMDWQPKYKAQETAPLFADGRAMRPLVDGTVAKETPPDDKDLTHGGADGGFRERVPLEVTEALLQRGQDRFNVFCTPCHDKAGAGRGMVVQRGFPPPINLSDERIRTMRDGELFQLITNGVRNMPSYRHQIPVDDRWAIVTWVRVLGHSQHATLADVPSEQRSNIQKEVSP